MSTQSDFSKAATNETQQEKPAQETARSPYELSAFEKWQIQEEARHASNHGGTSTFFRHFEHG